VGRYLAYSAAEDPAPQWECARGHRFALRPRFVRAGAWCSDCRKAASPWSRALARAESLGGVCLDASDPTHKSVRWRCANGHRWWAKPTVIHTAWTWCPQCAWDRQAERMRSEARDSR